MTDHQYTDSGTTHTMMTAQGKRTMRVISEEEYQRLREAERRLSTIEARCKRGLADTVGRFASLTELAGYRRALGVILAIVRGDIDE